jgi:hypothetical protein
MFNRFGVLTDILIDQNTIPWGFPRVVWKGIDWSSNYFMKPFEVNILVQRMVQMVKQILHKYGLQKGHTSLDWKL